MEVLTTAETEQGERSVDSPVKRGRGRPQGSKKMKVCIKDVNLTEMASASSNGTPRKARGRPPKKPKQPGEENADGPGKSHRGRGRPKGTKNSIRSEDGSTTPQTLKKRGRPKKSGDLLNGGSGRGRPKGSIKRKFESSTSSQEEDGSSATPRKRGRPKGSSNTKSGKEREVKSEGDGWTDACLNLPKRSRGRPRKSEVNSTSEGNRIKKKAHMGRGRPRKLESGGSQAIKRGRGRPKGSLTKKTSPYKSHNKVGQYRKLPAIPVKGQRRGRPSLQPAKRGRPRKNPLPSPDELKKPKVWKPLGRPRKYPRVDPPEGTPLSPQRGRGRPRKSESKKGAHLRKSGLMTPSSEGPQRKRGRPPSTHKSEDGVPRKRGRPRSSTSGTKSRSESELDSTFPNHSAAETEGELAENSTEATGSDKGHVKEKTVVAQESSSDGDQDQSSD